MNCSSRWRSRKRCATWAARSWDRRRRSTRRCASREAEAGRIDAAILDVNLAGRPSFPVADLLTGHGVPVVFATGYGDLPDGRAVGVSSVLLRKPLKRGELEAALSRMLSAPAGAAAPLVG